MGNYYFINTILMKIIVNLFLIIMIIIIIIIIVPEDEPKDGPNRYFLLSGFHHPHLVTHLSNVGVAINAIFRVVVGARASCYLKKMEERKQSKDEQTQVGDGDRMMELDRGGKEKMFIINYANLFLLCCS